MELRDVDPRRLRLPPSRSDGADPRKLARQISLYGHSTKGMPPLVVYEGADGEFVILDGVTRATRVAKLAPGTSLQVEIIGKSTRAFASLPAIGDLPT